MSSGFSLLSKNFEPSALPQWIDSNTIDRWISWNQLHNVSQDFSSKLGNYSYVDSSWIAPNISAETLTNQKLSLLARGFEAQENRFFCGIASLAISLKFHGIPCTQNTLAYDLFRPRHTDIKPLKAILALESFNKEIEPGLKLNDLEKILSYKGLNTLKIDAALISAQILKKEMIQAVRSPEICIIGNFCRKVLNGRGSGHIAVIADYSASKDAFLILDPNPNHTLYWAPADLLIAAHQTWDGPSARGIVLSHK